ncbi:hypothetical protein COLO4_01285, partial [Corchorus olitorius]
IEIVEGRQRFADDRGILALQPEFGRGFVTPVIKRAFAGVVGLNVIQTRQAVFHTLDQRGINMFTLPGLKHLLAEAVRPQSGNVVH